MYFINVIKISISFRTSVLVISHSVTFLLGYSVHYSRPGEGWVIPGYPFSRHTTWVTPTSPNKVTGDVFLFSIIILFYLFIYVFIYYRFFIGYVLKRIYDILGIIFTSLKVFYTNVRGWVFTTVLLTVSLLKSPGHFSVFWPILIML